MDSDRRQPATEPAALPAPEPSALPVPEGTALEIVARIADGIVRFDRDWRCIYVNERGAALVGKHPTEMLGSLAGDEFPGFSGSAFEVAHARALRDGQPVRIETYVRTLDQWFENRIFPLDEGVLAFFADITARKRAEVALRESEARLLRAQTVAGIGSWEFDLETGQISGSAQARQIYGLSHDDPSNAWSIPTMLTVEKDRARLEEAMGALVGERLPYDVQYRVRRPSDGAIRVVHSLAEMVPDAAGGPPRIVGTIQDVTERVAADEERPRLARAIEQATDIVMLEGIDRRISYVNPAFTRIYGYAADEVIGRPPDFLNSGLHPASFWAERDAVVRADRIWTGTIRNRCRDGSVVEVDASISPVRGEDGKISGYVQVARDVTAQRALEGRLIDAQRMEAIGQLAGGIAHDFNNLLTAIRGYACVVLDSLPAADTGRRDDLAQIIEGADRAALLTRQLLAYSRRQVLEPVVVDPAAVAAGVLPMLRRLIGEHIDLRFRPDPAGGHVKVDPGQLEQVIVNLAVNARDAMPHGGQLTIDTGRVEPGPGDPAAPVAPVGGPRPTGSYLRLSFTDTGTGIDPATISRIFDPFFTTKGPGKGTGMGLATVEGIVTQSGGRVTVETALGIGTTFHVDLPEVDEPPTPAPQRSAPGAARGSETILVVEDDDAVRGFARRVLEDRGYVVIEAPDAQRALEIAAEPQPRFDLLLSDVVMPGLSGTELAARLAAERPGLQVVLASGYAEDAEIGGEIPPERFAFIPKPYTGEVLLATVGRSLGHPPGGSRGEPGGRRPPIAPEAPGQRP